MRRAPKLNSRHPTGLLYDNKAVVFTVFLLAESATTCAKSIRHENAPRPWGIQDDDGEIGEGTSDAFYSIEAAQQGNDRAKTLRAARTATVQATRVTRVTFFKLALPKSIVGSREAAQDESNCT